MGNRGSHTEEQSTNRILVKPVVLIATHKRLPITTENLKRLERQTLVPHVVLVVSNNSEFQYYQNAFPLVTCIRVENEPLGAKWQAGVCAIPQDTNPLIILGSDDILGETFVENACRIIASGVHFIGLKRFWQHHNKKAYLCDYKPQQPIGGGRVFSHDMLEYLGYKIFNIDDRRHLDNFVMNSISQSGLRVKLCHDIEKDGLEIHAMKGSWPMMNPFDKRHRNISIVRVEESGKILPGTMLPGITL